MRALLGPSQCGLGLMDYFFFYGLKSNGLEHLKDKRLTEVTFGVTINVYRLMQVTFKSNDAQLWSFHSRTVWNTALES